MTGSRKTVAIVGAGIVGVSTAIWLQRDGHDVILIDRKGPGEGTSFGNGGVLASCSVVPVAVPGLMRKAPGMLLSANQPLFLKWSYLPKLAPWLMKFMRNATAEAVDRRAAALTNIIGDSLADHQALAAGTGAEKWIVPSDYLFLYNDRAHYEGDAFGFSVRRKYGFEWDVLGGQAFADYDPAFGPALTCAARFAGHGRITDPGRHVKDLAAHVEANGGRIGIADVEDVVREGGKVAGILLESAGQGGAVSHLAIGIGVNLAEAPPPEVLEPGAHPAASLLGETGLRIPPEEFLAPLANAFDRWERQLATYGFAPIRTAWLDRAARLGQPITARTGTEIFEGTFETIAEDGALVLATPQGRRVIPAADVYF